MRIYHGSLDEVKKPEIRKPNRTLDYGYGFYATSSYEQAEAWVRRRMNENNKPFGYVNIYEIDFNILTTLNILSFESPSENWLDFVMQNRIQKGFEHNYDVVYGPVANDRVYASFALYESGLINKQNLISELRTYKLVDQYLFHTEEALRTIKFIEAQKIIL